MLLNRKTTLMLLGAFVVAGGVVLGTGAFSTVEADRTVSLDLAGDNAALLQLEANNTAITSNSQGGQGVDELSIESSQLNANATTTFDYAINVTNNGPNDVDLYVTGTNLGDGAVVNINKTGASSIVGSGNSVDLNSGDSVHITVVVNLRDGNTVSQLDGVDTITFVAE